MQTSPRYTKRPPQPAGSNRRNANKHARQCQIRAQREAARQRLDRKLAEVRA